MGNIDEFDLAAPTKEKIAALLQLMHTGKGAGEKVVQKLRRAEPTVIDDILIAMQKDADPDLRYLAVEALFGLRASSAVEAISQLLKDEFVGNRCAACRFIMEMKNPWLSPLLLDRLQKDPEGSVRYIAATALGAIGDSSALRGLGDAAEQDAGTDHEGRPISERAARSIADIKARTHQM
jgi:HEAT repeat protein